MALIAASRPEGGLVFGTPGSSMITYQVLILEYLVSCPDVQAASEACLLAKVTSSAFLSYAFLYPCQQGGGVIFIRLIYLSWGIVEYDLTIVL